MSLRLAIFDLDGTLKQARDPYVYLHEKLGTWQAAEPITARGVAGELDYDEWLRLDVGLWQGISRTAIMAALRENPYLPGALETIRALKDAGVQVAIVSTGLLVHAELVQAELGLDRIFGNEVLFEDGLATGEARTLVAENGKGQIVETLRVELGMTPEECLAVGDGSSDADMFSRVRLGVAVNPSSERVRAAAGLVIEEADLSSLLTRVHGLLPGWLPGHGGLPVLWN
jgi:phosphoserine phosphatase